jgi:hypothetical protein
MPSRLRNRNLANVLEALTQYSVDGGGYSFISASAYGKLQIIITVEDEPAFIAHHLAQVRKDVVSSSSERGSVRGEFLTTSLRQTALRREGKPPEKVLQLLGEIERGRPELGD